MKSKKSLTSKLLVVVAALLQTAAGAVMAQQPAMVEVNNRPPVGLVLLDKLMSGRSRVGDQVYFETLANVCDSDNHVLIPAGSPAYGRVTRSKGSGMFGKRGQLAFTCEYAVLPNGDHVPLTGEKISKAGTNDIAAAAAVTVLVTPLGLFIKGGTVEVDKGTPITMYVADGANIAPVDQAPPGVHADFMLQDKNATDIIGTVTAFDGNEYTIGGDRGQLSTVSLAEIKAISVLPPAPGG